jgi:oxamate amidohydrolase
VRFTESPPVETPQFSQGAITSPHVAASEAGAAILREGGNAVEAMIAVAATLAVVYPHMNGIGGDNFWVIRAPSGRVRAIEACGYAGSHATIERYAKLELEAIPPRGPQAVLTVPGAVGGWMVAAEIARENGGRLPLDMLLHHAVQAAKEGHKVGASEARYTVKEEAAVLALPFFTDTFFIDGKKPGAGATRRMPVLAGTLRQLSDVGLDDFYRGDVGREIAADLEQAGTSITRTDMLGYRAIERPAMSARIKDCTIHMPPPPSQGFAGLMMLGITDALDVDARDPVAQAHAFIESVKRANTLRDRMVTEYDRMPEDIESYLTPEHFGYEASQIDRARAASWPLPPVADGDTVWAGAIDKNGLSVSLIQSLFWEYGSGVVLPKTGILMQNRGLGFSLDPKALNGLKPGRKPFHSLHAPLAVFDDGRIMPYGSMGGEAQPQVAAQNFIRAVRLGFSPKAALDHPRLVFSRAWKAERATVKAEGRSDPAMLAALRRLGHEVDEHPLPYADSFGHAGMMVRHPRGMIEADHDPRADGGAAGH